MGLNIYINSVESENLLQSQDEQDSPESHQLQKQRKHELNVKARLYEKYDNKNSFYILTKLDFLYSLHLYTFFFFFFFLPIGASCTCLINLFYTFIVNVSEINIFRSTHGVQ